MVKLNAYISCNGDAREAAEFYKSVFGGEVYMDTYEKFAGKMPMLDADKDKIMHAYLKGDNGIELMMADTPTGVPFTKGSQISLSLSGEDEAVVRAYWDKLSEGGSVTMPMEKAPWGDVFGMLTDKFGINWMVDVTSAENADKV
ncbi:MAG TPA: VOC family protein [Candidatus Saccharimonadales bacterium]|nr:VOC family protein [Candidatus Saccharimonadales bacterium]